MDKHGSSFSTFYRRVKSKSPTILVLRTTENEVGLDMSAENEKRVTHEGRAHVRD